MKRAATVSVTFLLLSSVCVPLYSADDEASDLVGVWDVISMEVGGIARDEINYGGMRFRFTKESVEIGAGRRTPAGISGKPPLKGTCVIDDSRSPPHLTFTFDLGENKRTMRWIYEVEEDILILGFIGRSRDEAVGGIKRPRGFDTKDIRLVVYKCKRIDLN